MFARWLYDAVHWWSPPSQKNNNGKVQNTARASACAVHIVHIYFIDASAYMLQNHIFAPMVTCSVQSCGMTYVRGGANADSTSWFMHFSWLQPKHLLPHGNKYFRAELFVSSRLQLEEYRLWICRIWRCVRLRIRAVIAVLAQVGNPVRCL